MFKQVQQVLAFELEINHSKCNKVKSLCLEFGRGTGIEEA